MSIAFHTQHPNLKRPRSTSQPPSPSSSSPKRAASETDDPSEIGSSLLGQHMDMTSGAARASSPLRERDSSSGEWVQRTEDVHLNEVENQGNDRYKQLYNDVLGEFKNKVGITWM